MSECGDCGQETVGAAGEIEDEILKGMDEFLLGVSYECVECERRLDPLEENPSFQKETKTNKFLEKEDLRYGME